MNNRIAAPASIDELPRARRWFVEQLGEERAKAVAARARSAATYTASHTIASLLAWLRRLIEKSVAQGAGLESTVERLRGRLLVAWGNVESLAKKKTAAAPAATAAAQRSAWFAERRAYIKKREDEQLAALDHHGNVVFRRIVVTEENCPSCESLANLVLPMTDPRWTVAKPPELHERCDCETNLQIEDGAPADPASDTELRDYLRPIANATWRMMREAHRRGERRVTVAPGVELKIGRTTVGPCLALVMDTTTHTIFYGQNIPRRALPALSSWPVPLRARIVEQRNAIRRKHRQAAADGSYIRNGTPGTHAEVLAARRLVEARPDARPSEIAVFNLLSESFDEEFPPMMACCAWACSGILHDTRQLTDVSAGGVRRAKTEVINPAAPWVTPTVVRPGPPAVPPRRRGRLSATEDPMQTSTQRSVSEDELQYDGERWTLDGRGFTGVVRYPTPERADVTLEDGIEHGAFVEYHENGSVSVAGECFEGVAHGILRHWNEHGVLVLEELVEFGEALASREWDEDGRLVREDPLSSDPWWTDSNREFHPDAPEVPRAFAESAEDAQRRWTRKSDRG